MKLTLTVDGKVYEVDVEVAVPEPPRPGYVPPSSSAAASSATSSPQQTSTPSAGSTQQVADESKVCRSPISGIIVRVLAQPGQAIQANDVLMVLEAMKMETEITSPIDGKIARVNGTVGEGVKAGQVLVEFE